MNKNKLRVKVLEEFDSGNIVSEKNLGISEEEFDEIVRFLDREDYITDVMYVDDRPLLFDGGVYLTEKGENYLNDNKTF